MSTASAPRPAFSYSQGVVHRGCLYVAGQVPRDPVTGGVPDAFSDQARRALDNLAAVADAAGGSLHDALRVGVYLASLASIDELDAIYAEYFVEPYPVRTTIEAGLRGYLIEVDAIIAVPEGEEEGE